MHGWCWWAKLLVESPLMHPITFLLFNLKHFNLLWFRTQIWLDFRYNNFWGLSSKALFFIRATKRASFPLEIFFSIRSNCLMTLKKSRTCDSLNLEIVKVQQTGKLHTWRFYFVHFVQSDKYHVFVNLFPR